MTLRRLSSATVLALCPTILAAGYSGSGEVTVLPGDFYEVTPKKSRATSDFWCAIGSYASARLGAPATQAIYVARGRGPASSGAGKSAVLFTLSPPDTAAPSSYSTSVEIVGNTLSVAQAQQACSDRLVND